MADTQKNPNALILSPKAAENTIAEIKSEILTLASKHEDTDWEFEAFKLNVLRAIDNETALKCTVLSLRHAVIEACRYGFMPNTSEGLCYLIPYWNGKNRCYDMHFQLGYKGITTLLYRMNVAPETWPVYQSDLPTLVFKRTHDGTILDFPVKLYASEEERGPLVGVIANLKLLGKEHSIIQPIDLAYIEKIKASLKAKNQRGELPEVWNKHFVEMARKTALIYGSKYLPRQDSLAAKMLMSAIRSDAAPLRDEFEREELQEGEGFTVVASEVNKPETKAEKMKANLRETSSKYVANGNGNGNTTTEKTSSENHHYTAFYDLVKQRDIEIAVHKEAKESATKDGKVDWELAFKNLQTKINDDAILEKRSNYEEWLLKLRESGKMKNLDTVLKAELQVESVKVPDDKLEVAIKLCQRLAKQLGIE